MMEKIMEYFMNNMDSYLLAVRQHIWVSLLSVACALLIGVPFGILNTKNDRAYQLVTSVFNTFRIVPSLAVLILLIPVMGTGVKPAVVALVLLAIPPILINTALAYRSVPDSVVESARGMGMSDGQLFWKVRIPLSLPFIFTGLKTAAVEVIASATLATYIGGGGLGTIIFTGLGLNRTDLLLIGGLSVAVLAILVSGILNLLDRRILRYTHLGTSQ